MKMDVWDNLVKADETSQSRRIETPRQSSNARPWPPIMLRDFLRDYDTEAINVSADTTVGHVADFLAVSPGAVVAVFDDSQKFLGVAVDEDAMALIKRDGVGALDYPIAEAVQRSRPVFSITDSPYVVLFQMREEGWDRVAVSERGRVIGVVRRRDLVRFIEG